MIDSSKKWEVKTTCGFAGGTNRAAGVTLYVETHSDTVEEVRELVEGVPKLLAEIEKLNESRRIAIQMRNLLFNCKWVLVAAGPPTVEKVQLLDAIRDTLNLAESDL